MSSFESIPNHDKNVGLVSTFLCLPVALANQIILRGFDCVSCERLIENKRLQLSSIGASLASSAEPFSSLFAGLPS